MHGPDWTGRLVLEDRPDSDAWSDPAGDRQEDGEGDAAHGAKLIGVRCGKLQGSPGAVPKTATTIWIVSQ